MFHTKIWHIDLECPSQQCQGHLHTGYLLWMCGCPHWLGGLREKSIGGPCLSVLSFPLVQRQPSLLIALKCIIHDSVALMHAQLVIPAFMKGKNQLDPIDVDKTRGVAHVSIHVEWVIGLLCRKYTILDDTLAAYRLTCNPHGNPEDQVPMIHRTIRVCPGLVNVYGPIVPFD